MSKKWLFLGLLAATFIVNGLGFFLSKQGFVLNESKTIWISEMPETPWPWDAQGTVMLKPSLGCVGGLLVPGTSRGMLTREWKHTGKESTFRLRADWRAGDETLLSAPLYLEGQNLLRKKYLEHLSELKADPSPIRSQVEKRTVWDSWWSAKFEAMSDQEVKITLDQSLDADSAARILSHPVWGWYAQQNFKTDFQKEGFTAWVSTGVYSVRKWRRKEIHLASRNGVGDFMPQNVFRQIKFQSAPVVNPAVDFIEADQREQLSGKYTPADLGVFSGLSELEVGWVCRSRLSSGSVCADQVVAETMRDILSTRISGGGMDLPMQSARRVRFRIAEGSGDYRHLAVSGLEKLKKVGFNLDAISYFFKNSADADLELAFQAVGDFSVSESIKSGGGFFAPVARVTTTVFMKDTPAGGNPFEHAFFYLDSK